MLYRSNGRWISRIWRRYDRHWIAYKRKLLSVWQDRRDTHLFNPSRILSQLLVAIDSQSWGESCSRSLRMRQPHSLDCCLALLCWLLSSFNWLLWFRNFLHIESETKHVKWRDIVCDLESYSFFVEIASVNVEDRNRRSIVWNHSTSYRKGHLLFSRVLSHWYAKFSLVVKMPAIWPVGQVKKSYPYHLIRKGLGVFLRP